MNLQVTSGSQLMEYKRESDLPFYRVNSDPFQVSHRWEKMKVDPDFGAVIQTLWQCNKNALDSGLFHWTWFDSIKQLFADDISLQAFFLSFSEVFREQGRIVDLLWFISNLDLVNFAELFAGYGDGNRRTFHKNMIFNFYWFQQLMKHYEGNWFQPYDRFTEFRRMWDRSHRWIAAKIHEQMKYYGEVNIQFYQGDGYGTMDFFFNFNTGETRIEMKDFILWGDRDFEWFSEYLNKNNPFQNKERLNFLYPMWYRWFIFPMIWVTKIVLRTREKQRYEYTNKGQITPNPQSNIPKRIHWLIEST